MNSNTITKPKSNYCNKRSKTSKPTSPPQKVEHAYVTYFIYSFIGNILQNSDVKARIVTSRIVTGRQRHNDKEESYINELNMLSTERENHYRSDSGVGDKKRIQLQQHYKVGDDDDE